MTTGLTNLGHKSAAAVMAFGAFLLIASSLNQILFVLVANVISAGGSISDTLIGYYNRGQWIIGISILVTGAISWLLPNWMNKLEKIFFGVSLRVFGFSLAAICLGMALGTQYLLFDNIPHVTDAISHDFQARLLLEGHVVAPLPPCPDAFFQHHFIMTASGKWFSKYTPGHPVLLAIGYFLNVPFLPVALCHALSAVLFFLLVRRFYSENTGRISAILFTTSPLATLLSASFMSHTSFLFMVLAGTYGLVRSFDLKDINFNSRAIAWSIFAGFFWGWALITRPQDAAICGLMVIASCLICSPRSSWLNLLATGSKAVVGMIPPLMLYLIWNKQQYGVFLTLGYGFTQDQVIQRVYQATFGLSEHFTFKDALKLMFNTAYRFDRAMLGWPLTIPLCIPALFRHHLDRRDLACVAACAIHAGVYFFYDYYGLEYEARYYFNLLPFAIILLVRSFFSSEVQQSRSRLAVLFVIAMIAHNALNFWPGVIGTTYGKDYEQSTTALHRDALAAGLDHAVVLIDSSGEEAFRFSSGMLYNHPFLRSGIIYARLIDDQTTFCLKTNFSYRIFYSAKRTSPELHFEFTPVP